MRERPFARGPSGENARSPVARCQVVTHERNYRGQCVTCRRASRNAYHRRLSPQIKRDRQNTYNQKHRNEVNAAQNCRRERKSLVNLRIAGGASLREKLRQACLFLTPENGVYLPPLVFEAPNGTRKYDDWRSAQRLLQESQP